MNIQTVVQMDQETFEEMKTIIEELAHLYNNEHDYEMLSSRANDLVEKLKRKE